MMARETAPGRCPLRPARCSRRATPFGLPICSTWSTGAKSTPRSRLDVQTTARSRSLRRPSSTQSRTSRSSDPWCSAMRAGPIGPRLEDRLVPDLGLRAHVGEDERRLARARSRGSPAAAASARCGPPTESARSSRGRRLSITISFASSPLTMAARSIARGPDEAGERVVEVGERRRQPPDAQSRDRRPRSRASASSVCTPRLVPISSCHSSTTIAARCAKRSRQSARARNSVRLSGVVTSAVGSRLPWRARAARSGVAGAHVDGPVRRQSGGGPRERETGVAGQRAQRRDPEQGERRRGVRRAGGAEQHAAAAPRHRSCPCRWARGRVPTLPRAYAAQTSSWNANGAQPCVANHARARASGSLWASADDGCMRAFYGRGVQPLANATPRRRPRDRGEAVTLA